MTGRLLLRILQDMTKEQLSHPVFLKTEDVNGDLSAEKVINCYALDNIVWIQTESTLLQA